MSAYSLIIKLYHKASGMGLLSGQDMNRVTFSVVAIMLLAAATTLPFVLNAGFGKAPQAQLSRWKRLPTTGTASSITNCPRRFTGQKNMLAAWWDFLMTKRENARPAQPLPLVKTDLATLPLGQDVMVWLGHSSVPAAGGKTHPDRPGVQRLRGAVLLYQ